MREEPSSPRRPSWTSTGLRLGGFALRSTTAFLPRWRTEASTRSDSFGFLVLQKITSLIIALAWVHLRCPNYCPREGFDWLWWDVLTSTANRHRKGKSRERVWLFASPRCEQNCSPCSTAVRPFRSLALQVCSHTILCSMWDIAHWTLPATIRWCMAWERHKWFHLGSSTKLPWLAAASVSPEHPDHWCPAHHSRRRSIQLPNGNAAMLVASFLRATGKHPSCPHELGVASLHQVWDRLCRSLLPLVVWPEHMNPEGPQAPEIVQRQCPAISEETFSTELPCRTTS